MGQFASAEGKKGDEFYTLSCVVKLLVEMIEPFVRGGFTFRDPNVPGWSSCATLG